MTRRSLASLVLLALTVGVPGCGLVIEPPYVGPQNRCEGEGDCSSGTCDVELGMCVSDSPEAYVYVIQAVLPADGIVGRPPLVIEAGPFVAANGTTNDVVVRRPVPVHGQIRSEGLPVDADLVFTPRTSGASPTVAPVVVGTRVDPMEGASDYATELVPGLIYDVEVRPRGEDAARYWPLRSELVLETGQRFDVSEYPTLRVGQEPIHGVVVDPSLYAQSGLEVRAIEIETGRLVSSVATTGNWTRPGETDPEPGRFEIFVDPSAGPWVFRISAPPSYQEDRAFPTITVDPSVLVPDADDLLHMLVPSPTDGRCFAGTVEFPSGQGAAIGATITMRSRTIEYGGTGLVGSFIVQLVSQGASDPATTPIGCSGAHLPPGGFEANVLPGEYEIEIQPLEPELGVFVGEVLIGTERDTLGHVFAMPTRTLLNGTVQRSDDERIRDARVRAVPLHAPVMDPITRAASLLNRQGETITDATGQFSLPLDVGLFDLVVEPPSGSGFPWMVRPEFGIGGSAAPVSEVFDVRAPVAIHGGAMFEDGSAVSGAEIAVYALVGEDGAQRPVPIGRATSAADGTFLLLLPPEI